MKRNFKTGIDLSNHFETMDLIYSQMNFNYNYEMGKRIYKKYNDTFENPKCHHSCASYSCMIQ